MQRHLELARLQTKPNFLSSMVTGDESWVYEYDPETKLQNAEWHTPTSPSPKRARMAKSRVKSKHAHCILWR